MITKSPSKRQSIKLTVQPETIQQLKKIAAECDLPISCIAQIAMDAGLDKLERDITQGEEKTDGQRTPERSK